MAVNETWVWLAGLRLGIEVRSAVTCDRPRPTVVFSTDGPNAAHNEGLGSFIGSCEGRVTELRGKVTAGTSGSSSSIVGPTLGGIIPQRTEGRTPYAPIVGSDVLHQRLVGVRRD
ncbi:hypothetical protein KPB2_5362 [Klebsiella pneumoniae Kb677]|nr:hypothetical protein KPB2_5362 [Klebsiella pneumoniae Kb677]